MKLQMRSKIASIHNKIEVTDEYGEAVYHIQSKVVSIHDTTFLKRADGGDIATITKKVVSLHDTHFIEMNDGRTVEIRPELLHLTKDVVDIDALGWKLVGDIVQHNYQLLDAQGQILAEIHRKWISLHNTYEIDARQEDSLDMIVAVLIALDKIVEDRRRTMASSSSSSGD